MALDVFFGRHAMYMVGRPLRVIRTSNNTCIVYWCSSVQTYQVLSRLISCKGLSISATRKLDEFSTTRLFTLQKKAFFEQWKTWAWSTTAIRLDLRIRRVLKTDDEIKIGAQTTPRAIARSMSSPGDWTAFWMQRVRELQSHNERTNFLLGKRKREENMVLWKVLNVPRCPEHPH